MDDNDFLQALAKGGIQVGELAKLYYPGGRDIKTLHKEEAIRETNEELAKKDAIIYEAAIQVEGLYIRVDVLEKMGNRLNLIEVKSKSWSSDETFLTQKNTITSGWQSYLYDVAFQYRVLQKAFPDYQIEPYLMLIDKTQRATVDGLHQYFKVVEDDQDKKRSSVVPKEGITAADLGKQILHPVHVGEYINLIFEGKAREPVSEAEAAGFDVWMDTLSNHLRNDKKYPVTIGSKCKSCEYRISRDKLKQGELSGFEECWSKALGWKSSDFEDPHIFDIWNYRSAHKLLDQGVYKMDEMVPGLLPASPERLTENDFLDNKQRQTLQIAKAVGYLDKSEFVHPQLFLEMEKWKKPLHFIDFEAVLAAIPFHKGMQPYDYIPFQFSCHTIYEDGSVEHRADWIEKRPGVFPNFEFVRKLKKCLEVDDGTIFRYHNFENTVLNKVAEQIREFKPDDADVLIEWINSITNDGGREMVDQFDLIKKYYYSPLLRGSISIKNVLPAVLSESRALKEIYSKPYSGLYIKDKVFYSEDPLTGNAINPYKLLGQISDVIPDDEKADEVMRSDREIISDGGAAMMAWSRLQFDDVPQDKRMNTLLSLYEYCELDTLAMVMIHQHWEWLIESSKDQ